jgi:surface antigen
MRKINSFAAVAVAGLLVAGCSNGAGQGPGTGQTLGTIAGAVAGGVLGNQVGGGSGRTAATVVGVVAGGLIGNRLGQLVDESDRRRAQEAEYRALEFSKADSPVVWRNPDKNVYGEVVPGPSFQQGNFQNCREYTHTIFIDGKPEVAKGRACRNADGSWQTVS